MSGANQSKSGAEAYDRVSKVMQSQQFKFMMADVEVKKGWKILDMGCGTGFDTASLSTLVGEQGQVIGIDPIAERIEVAKENYQNDSTKFHVAYGKDACNFGTDFDLVISNQVMHWIPPAEKELTFESISQCLKPAGQFVFLMSKKKEIDPESKILKLLGSMPKEIMAGSISQLFYETKEDLEKMVLANGFDHVTVMETSNHTEFDTADDLLQWVASSFHVVQFDKVYQSMKEFFKDKDVSYVYNEEGKVDMDIDVLLVTCTKQK